MTLRCLICKLRLTLSRSLTRGPDGRFDDTQLAAIIKDACVILLDNCGAIS